MRASGTKWGLDHAGDSDLSEEEAVNTPRVSGFQLPGNEKVQERR